MTQYLEKGLIAVCSVLILMMIVLMNVEVFGRYLFGISTRIAEEYSGYLFCAATMLGFYPAVMRGRFLRIASLLSFLGTRARAAWEVAIAVLSAVFCLLLAWQTWGLFTMSRRFGSISLEYSGTPLMYPQLIMPLGLSLLAVGILLRVAVVARQILRGNPQALEDENNVLD